MSKKCPYCGLYNTETAVGNWIERGVINTGRGVIAAGAGVIMSIFHPSMGGGDCYQNLAKHQTIRAIQGLPLLQLR